MVGGVTIRICMHALVSGRVSSSKSWSVVCCGGKVIVEKHTRVAEAQLQKGICHGGRGDDPNMHACTCLRTSSMHKKGSSCTKMKVVLPSQTSPREGIQRVFAACSGGIRGVFVGIRGYLRVFEGISVMCAYLHTFNPPLPPLPNFKMFPYYFWTR